MTVEQVNAEFDQPEIALAPSIDATTKARHEIFERICFTQTITPQQLQSAKQQEIAEYIKQMDPDLVIDAPGLASLGEMAKEFAAYQVAHQDESCQNLM